MTGPSTGAHDRASASPGGATAVADGDIVRASQVAFAKRHVRRFVEDDLPCGCSGEMGEHLEPIRGSGVADRAVIERARHQERGHFDRSECFRGIPGFRRRGAHHHRGIDPWFQKTAAGREGLADDRLCRMGAERVPGHPDVLQIQPVKQRMILVIVQGAERINDRGNVVGAGDEVPDGSCLLHCCQPLCGRKVFPDCFITAGVLDKGHHISALRPMIAEVGIVVP